MAPHPGPFLAPSALGGREKPESITLELYVIGRDSFRVFLTTPPPSITGSYMHDVTSEILGLHGRVRLCSNKSVTWSVLVVGAGIPVFSGGKNGLA